MTQQVQCYTYFFNWITCWSHITKIDNQYKIKLYIDILDWDGINPNYI
jgi:hypothetical protein